MAKINGNIGWIITVGAMAAAAVASYAVWGRDVTEMKPEVKLNTEHRIQDDERDKYMAETLDQILREVRK